MTSLFLLSALVLQAGSSGETAAAPPPPDTKRSEALPALATGALSGYDDGFFLRAADGSAELKIGGLFQFLGRVNEGRRDPSSEFDLKRMRPEFTGRFEEDFRFALETNFGQNDVELEEAWLGVELDAEDAILKFGRMKAPFGLEEIRSRRHIPFPVFSILNQFSPAEQHGVFWSDRCGPMELGAAIYNGGGGDEGDDGKEIAVRAMLHPFEKGGRRRVRNLQVGAALTYGREHRSVAGDNLYNAAHLPLATFAPGANLDGDQLRLGLEGAWFDGPDMLQAEFMHMRQEMSSGGGRANVDYFGAYVSAQHVLTGEDISFAGVHPTQKFRLRRGERGGGAWVATTRLSYLRFDDSLRKSGALNPQDGTSNVTSLWFGANLYLNEHVILRNSFVYSLYAGQIHADGHTLSGEAALLFELQFHF